MKNLLNKIRFTCSKETLTFFLSVYLGTVLNMSLYSQLFTIFNAMQNVNVFFVISIPFFVVFCRFLSFFVVFCLNFILNLLNWKYIIKPLFILLVVISSMVSYAMIKYGIVFNHEMMQNIFETNVAEASSYINSSSVVYIALLTLPAACVILVAKIHYGTVINEQVRRACSLLISVLVVFLIAFFFYKDYVSVGRNNTSLRSQIVPTYYIGSVYKYINKAYFSKPIAFMELGKDAVRDVKATETKPSVTILVLGETSRSSNHSLNGYERDTNRYTSQHGIISFADVTACGTATALSVPCMFSNMERESYDEQRAKNQDNVIDIIQRAGVEVTWIENDGGCKGVCDRVTTIEINPTRENVYCNGKTCYDEVFLPEIDNELRKLNGNDKLIVMHVIGSHGPTYYLRYPKEKRVFTPDCQRSDIENCTSEELINTYDNTIAYTDYVIAQVIDKLKSSTLSERYNTNLLYISDHGESLGEFGLYLHGAPYNFAPDYQKNIPLMMWMSPDYIRERAIDVSCLKEKAKSTAYSHDHLFSTLLSLVGVSTAEADPKLDILSECK